jgi:hypothetical protein
MQNKIKKVKGRILGRWGERTKERENKKSTLYASMEIPK